MPLPQKTKTNKNASHGTSLNNVYYCFVYKVNSKDSCADGNHTALLHVSADDVMENKIADIVMKHDVELSDDISNFLTWLVNVAAPYVTILKEENYIQHRHSLLSMDPAQITFLMKEKIQGNFCLLIK